jgi:hypothetical protein
MTTFLEHFREKPNSWETEELGRHDPHTYLGEHVDIPLPDRLPFKRITRAATRICPGP